MSAAGASENTLIYLRRVFKRFRERKPMEILQAEIETQNELRRTLNWIQLTAVGVGGTIGVGIYLLGGQGAAMFAGPSIIISFILAGFVALLSALSHAEMASLMSSSGSAYTYTYAALGEYPAWFIGWNLALLYQLSALTVVASWSQYLIDLIRLISGSSDVFWFLAAPIVWVESTESFHITGQVINLPSIVITLAITILLIIGIRQTAMFNLVFVVIKIIILLVYTFACAKYVDRKNYEPFFPPNQGSFGEFGVTGMLQACTYVFFAFIGFDFIGTVAQEARETSRSLPRAIIASSLISLLIYICLLTVMIGLVPYQLLNTDDPLVVTIKATAYGSWLPILMDLGALISITSVALIVLLAQIRVFYAMAHDGLLPPIFAKIHSSTKTPWLSTIISGIFCAVISGFCPVDLIGETASISALVSYIFVHIDVIVMRYTHPQRVIMRPFQVPFGPWPIPLLGILSCGLILKGISKDTVYRFIVWTILGQIVYFSYGFWHSKIHVSNKSHSSALAYELSPTTTSHDTFSTFSNESSEPPTNVLPVAYSDATPNQLVFATASEESV